MLDKSSLLNGVSRYLEKNVIYGNILIHKSLVRELEEESRDGMVSGDIALEEINKVKEMSERLLIGFDIVGDGTKESDVALREFCQSKGCTVVTSDDLQRKMCDLMKVQCILLQPLPEDRISIETYFDENTMSVHLKEDSKPKAKRGKPGEWEFVELSSDPLTKADMKRIVSDVVNSVRFVKGSFIEIERKGSMIIQLGNYRIVVTRPPLSDGWEMTITRPVARRSMDDYSLDQRLLDKFRDHAEGIVIAGSPGMGKTTFAQALAEYYMRLGKIVKTIESPRDMHLPPDITQYSKNYAEIGELHDILLLSRPDYTVYDEMRNDEDFKLYTDLRLAGIGMIGVVHATSPIDAIHRFVSRVDLGTIPNILDTVVFIRNGTVEKVYSLEMIVKVPSGLREADLARPVVEIKDFLSDKAEYEMYVFGEQTMIVPVKSASGKGGDSMESRLNRIVENIIPDASVKYEEGEYVVNIPKEQIGKFNRKLTSRLRKLEKKHNIKIRIRLSE
ncbi:PINc/VapC family ATPase [Sulfuracidifex tepidarius]|uniref:KH and PIN-domain containing protein n=1 Tax=Sulfuracidifex tepidarius TaxID=1294262 RepID=A0A510DUX5_9CREN|nr:PINc/VapC family ATPase [Sulfuracidifex tepidarius]BBG23995.1 putative KH and PIN-domain containing protein [Sulfuracidifex tepidarius]BBG26750.1 putative KH and PIN-domain containing protein [Sulfuracidifex tepidarius]